MSVDALVQVFKDHSEVSPGVQAVLVALAWRTPQGSDSTVPTSYPDIATLTRQHVATVRRNVLEAMSIGACELVWARPGQKARYRVNRGEWHIEGSAEDLARALGMMQGVGTTRTPDSDPTRDAQGTQSTMPWGSEHDAHPLRDLREERKGAELFAERNPELFERLREKGHLG